MNTTLADLFELRICADPFSTVQASVGRLSGDEGDDSVTDGRQAWLRRRSIDFFPSRYFETWKGSVHVYLKGRFLRVGNHFRVVCIGLGLGLSRAVGAIGAYTAFGGLMSLYAERQKGSPRRRLESDKEDRSPWHISHRPWLVQPRWRDIDHRQTLMPLAIFSAR